MLSIPQTLRAPFEERLLEKAIPGKAHWSYIKWLRYYLDFCRKYDFPAEKKESLTPFPGFKVPISKTAAPNPSSGIPLNNKGKYAI